jgi:hypothetical protein
VLVGLACAFLAAGATMVLFVYGPFELLQGAGEMLEEAGLLVLAAATHSAVFAAPFALCAAVIGEWRGLRSVAYYAPAAVGIAALGFLAEYATEAAGEASVANAYAATAFLATGLAAGLAYWLFAGRHAAAPAASRTGISPASPAARVSSGAS